MIGRSQSPPWNGGGSTFAAAFSGGVNQLLKCDGLRLLLLRRMEPVMRNEMIWRRSRLQSYLHTFDFPETMTKRHGLEENTTSHLSRKSRVAGDPEEKRRPKHLKWNTRQRYPGMSEFHESRRSLQYRQEECLQRR